MVYLARIILLICPKAQDLNRALSDWRCMPSYEQHQSSAREYKILTRAQCLVQRRSLLQYLIIGVVTAEKLFVQPEQASTLCTTARGERNHDRLA